jgi:hypothetical protein
VRRQNWPLREASASGFSELGRKYETTGNRGAAGRGIALAVSAATALPAAAATSGSETFSGTIVTSGVSGTRTEISSVLVAQGVFRDVGRIVELPDLPTDPPNFSRDDLVFPEGTMHLVSAPVGITSFSLNPRNCLFRLTLQQTGKSPAAPGSSPPRPAASPIRSVARGLRPAIPTAAALSRNQGSTRWT